MHLWLLLHETPPDSCGEQKNNNVEICPDKDTTGKKLHVMSLTNIDAEPFNKWQQTNFNTTLKASYNMTKWDIFLG